jgi:hypothetical protein
MVDRVGTSSGSLSEPTGGITDELGNALLSTDTTSGEAQTLGPQLTREIVFGVPNADFSTLPEDPGENISDTNGLPYYTLIPGNEWGLLAPDNITAQVVPSPITTPAGVDLQFTIGAGAAENEALAIERWIPIAADQRGSLAARVLVSAYVDALGASFGECYLITEAAYYAADRATLLDSSVVEESFAYFAGIDELGNYGKTTDPYLATTVPAGSAWIRVRVGVRVLGGATTSTEQIHITNIRVARSVTSQEFVDSFPVATGANALLNLDSSVFSLRVNRGENTTIDPWSDLEALWQISPSPSTPSGNMTIGTYGISPDGAKYSDGATAVAANTTVQLTLNNAPDGGSYGFTTPVSNEVYAGHGTYLIVARASFESNGTGTYRRLFLYKNGASVGNTILTVDSSAAYTVTVTTVQQVGDSEPIELYARHDATTALDVTPVELSLIRLGDLW